MTQPAPLRVQQRAYTRERLLRAGAEVFDRKGYPAATVDDIVGAAGASRATFYLHFRTKSDVVAELGDRLLVETRAFYAELDGVLATGSRAAMRDWMARALQWMVDNRAVLTAADAFGGPESYRSVDSFVERMPRWLERWPQARRHEARTRIALLTNQFRGVLAFEMPVDGEHGDFTRENVLDGLTDVWLAGLQPPPA
ncbi:TetR/AcrR family transcriptional regulator [Pseudonocardia broussonetiae]|uniref:TetR/AcrR family transcriptional regulator n=1 Tax=Pseudonocardia broussonetiae TaxID=2736640 RepID=A0A6M6JDZ2_9PSEU|nr:TetR/AcrR family transcriptional regulator [Pseudonocardia broussonetiae]QJY45323.1 TetR/AcrR family transcriptional regulator [Pseudonocardia broussonetiae]